MADTGDEKPADEKPTEEFLLEKYKHLYEDSRHYDKMGWQVIVISSAITGAIITLLVGYELTDSGILASISAFIGILVSNYAIHALLKYRFHGAVVRNKLAILEAHLVPNKKICQKIST